MMGRDLQFLLLGFVISIWLMVVFVSDSMMTTIHPFLSANCVIDSINDALYILTRLFSPLTIQSFESCTMTLIPPTLVDSFQICITVIFYITRLRLNPGGVFSDLIILRDLPIFCQVPILLPLNVERVALDSCPQVQGRLVKERKTTSPSKSPNR